LPFLAAPITVALLLHFANFHDVLAANAAPLSRAAIFAIANYQAKEVILWHKFLLQLMDNSLHLTTLPILQHYGMYVWHINIDNFLAVQLPLALVNVFAQALQFLPIYLATL
jgi:hypothetical protein